MAISDAQKKSARKWDKANMTVLACKVKKEDAERFKLYCSAHGITVNNELKEHVMRCIGGEMPPGTAGATEAAYTCSFLHDHAKMAHSASEATGETTKEVK